MAEVFFYKEQFVDGDVVPVEDRGHQFGDGVYEVVRVYGGRPFLLDAHLDRFERSLAALGIANPFSRDRWHALIAEAVRRSGEAEAQVYWQVTRGSSPRLHTFPDTAPIASMVVRKASAKTSAHEPTLFALPDERWANVYVKSINLLPNVIAKEVAKRHQCAEALLVRNGTITEGSGSNAWFVRNGILYTAPANRYILGGITRAFVLSLASQTGIEVREEALSLEDLPSVDEVFFTSTTQEILSVSRVVTSTSLRPSLLHLPDTAPASLVPQFTDLETLWHKSGDGAVTRRLQQAFDIAVEKHRIYEEPPFTA